MLSDEGLYYHDVRWNRELSTPERPISNRSYTNVLDNNKNVVLVNTVGENEEGYTKKELQKARLAKRMYILMGRPSYRDFANVIRWNLVRNCPVEYSDVINAWNIYGEDVGGIRGKTTRIKPKVVDTDGIVKIPQELLYNLQDITLCADVMFVDKLVVCTTYSRKIGFTTVEVIKNQSIEKLYQALRKVLAIYVHREVPVTRLLTDRQFLPLDDKLLQDDDVKLTGQQVHLLTS